ncbi:MAG: two-component regulator propeller domain-containing protein [Bacteroidota bacterium]
MKTSSKEESTTSKPSPTVIGTPPPLVPNHNPYNDSNLVSQYIRSIYQDSRGNYWFGPAGQSVARYGGDTLEYYSRMAFFQGNPYVNQDEWNSVHAIAEDTNAHIWFGTDRGVVTYDGKSFRSYTEKDGLTNIRVGRKCILVDKSGTVWIGTQGGVFRYIPSADRAGGPCFSLFDLLPPIQLKGIMEDDTGHIWFATEEKGVFRYDGQRIHNMTEIEGLGDNYSGGMAQDKTGNIWFLMKDGIGRYDGKNISSYTAKDGLGGTEFWGLYIEESGIIWITARGSTTRFDPALAASDPNAFRVFTEADGLNCCVQSMYQDRAGNMWWGTGQGLYRFDGKRFYQVKQSGPW